MGICDGAAANCSAVLGVGDRNGKGEFGPRVLANTVWACGALQRALRARHGLLPVLARLLGMFIMTFSVWVRRLGFFLYPVFVEVFLL